MFIIIRIKLSRLILEGFADTSVSNVLVLVNGRKVNSIDISGPDWLQIPLETVERIEILRGAGSVLYADNAVGGVVNIVTKKGKGNLSGKTGITRGSYNMQKEDLEISASQGDFAYYFYSKYYETDGYRKNSDLCTKDFITRLDYNLTKRFSLDISGAWHKDDYGMPAGLSDQTELATLGRRGSADEK